MKAIAYTLYVVIVLLISGLARANAAQIDPVKAQFQTPVQVGQVQLNPTGSELQIAGTLPNPCYANPTAIVVHESENVLVLHLVSPAPTNACITQVKYFTTSLPLEYVSTSTQIDSSKVYTLKVDGTSFEMQVPGSALMVNL